MEYLSVPHISIQMNIVTTRDSVSPLHIFNNHKSSNRGRPIIIYGLEKARMSYLRYKLCMEFHMGSKI